MDRTYDDPLRVLTGGIAAFGTVFVVFAAMTAAMRRREVAVSEALILVGFAARRV